MKNLKSKILDNLPTIFIALVFIFGMTLTFNHAHSIPNLKPESEPLIPDTQLERKYDLRQLFTKDIPVYCGETQMVLDTSAHFL